MATHRHDIINGKRCYKRLNWFHTPDIWCSNYYFSRCKLALIAPEQLTSSQAALLTPIPGVQQPLVPKAVSPEQLSSEMPAKQQQQLPLKKE